MQFAAILTLALASVASASNNCTQGTKTVWTGATCTAVELAYDADDVYTENKKCPLDEKGVDTGGVCMTVTADKDFTNEWYGKTIPDGCTAKINYYDCETDCLDGIACDVNVALYEGLVPGLSNVACECSSASAKAVGVAAVVAAVVATVASML